MIIPAIVIGGLMLSNRKGKKKSATRTKRRIKLSNRKTWDKVTDRNIDKLHPAIQDKFRDAINELARMGVNVRLYSGFRSFAEQHNLWKKGRIDAGSKVTNAKAGQSYHNYGLAGDVVEIKNGRAIWDAASYRKIAPVFKKYGFTWGGDWKSFKDMPHFQMSFGRKTSELKHMSKNGTTWANVK